MKSCISIKPGLPLLMTAFLLTTIACDATKNGNRTEKPRPRPERLVLEKTETIRTGIGAKSVEMSPDGSRAYSMNLEECSVFEYDRNTRAIDRRLVFVMTPGKGWDYDKKVPIDSYQEKPVEGHFTHKGRFLWISLHNADGIVAWDLEAGDTAVDGQPFKAANLTYRLKMKTPAAAIDRGKAANAAALGLNAVIIKQLHEKPVFLTKKIRLRLFKTGATPKVIWSSPDGKYLFVSNWHSSSVSVLDIASADPAGWKVIKTLHTGSVPRGMTASDDSRYLYVAQMGDLFISVVDLASLEKTSQFRVGNNPRHILMSHGLLYASLCNEGRLIKVKVPEGTVTGSVKTLSSPRTIAVSPDGLFIWVTCYNDNKVQVYRTDNFRLLDTVTSWGRPVGVTVFQEGDRYEAWVCNHTNFQMNVYTYRGTAGIE